MKPLIIAKSSLIMLRWFIPSVSNLYNEFEQTFVYDTRIKITKMMMRIISSLQQPASICHSRIDNIDKHIVVH